MKAIIITETLDINQKEVLEVDPSILRDMKERLRPSKSFDYSKGDHTRQAEEDEKCMREGK